MKIKIIKCKNNRKNNNKMLIKFKFNWKIKIFHKKLVRKNYNYKKIKAFKWINNRNKN